MSVSIIGRASHCSVCNINKKKLPQGLGVCGKCKEIFYCSVECQLLDWARHKLECPKLWAVKKAKEVIATQQVQRLTQKMDEKEKEKLIFAFSKYRNKVIS